MPQNGAVIRHLVVLALFLCGAVASTWPLVLQLSSLAPDLGDPLLIAWILDWDAHALSSTPLHLFDAPIYYPATNMLAFSEHMTGIALVMLPFRAAGLSPVAVYNLALLLGMAFSGYGAYVLARLVTEDDLASVTGGVLYAFGSFSIGQVQHLQNIWNGWLPLMLAALLLYWRKPSIRRGALLAGAFAMNGLTNVYWLLFGGFTLVVMIGFLQFADPRRERAFWKRLGVSFLIASLILLPFLIPYQIVSEKYGERRTTFEASLGSATPMHWLVGSSRSLLYGRSLEQWRLDERQLFPGVVALILITAAAWRRRPADSVPRPPLPAVQVRRLDLLIVLLLALTLFVASQGRIVIGSIAFAGADVPAMLTTILVMVRFAPQLRAIVCSGRFTTGEWVGWLSLVLGFLGSLGWNFYLYPFLFRVVAPFRATRMPARWAVVAYIGIAVLAAMGASALAKRRRPVAILLLALVCVDVAARVRWTPVPPIPPVYTWLAGARPRAVIEVPMSAQHVFLYLHAQTLHRVPLVNGTSGFETPAHTRLRQLPYDDTFIAAAREAGAELLIVHEDRLTDSQRQQLSQLVTRLEPLQRFGPDAVFRIPRAPADTATAPRGSAPR